MFEQPPYGGEPHRDQEFPERPTTELPPYAQHDMSDEVPASEAGAEDSGSGDQSFGGFRDERRFAEPMDESAPESGSAPRAWAALPSNEIPNPVEYLPPPSYGDEAPPAAYGGGGEVPPEMAYRPAAPAPYSDLSTSALLRQVKPPPSGGWRRLLYRVSGGVINVGESPHTIRHNDLLVQANRPLDECYRIAFLSLKGGVGKTTVAATLGATFASVRADRVVAVDANPDRGTLSQKVPVETPATVRHLLRDAEGIERYSDVRSYTNQGPSRLEVLASESDPAVSEAFSAEDYARTLQVLEQFYSLVLTDCGTGLLHSAMSSVLANADTLIVVSSGSVDGARSASATLDWLDAHGYQDLVRQSIAVINAVRPRSGKVDMQKVVDHFARRCRAVRLLPFDPHLEEGAEISLERLRPDTREALIELAAVVADGFPGNERSHQPFFF